MPPITSLQTTSSKHRIIYYVQTFYKDDKYISILPIQQNPTGITHIYLAAIHLNDPPGSIHLNDHPFSDPYYDPLWPEVLALQASGIRVLGLLGGAAQGSFNRLDTGNPLYASQFEAYYIPLRDLLHRHSIQGLDLDVEESMTQQGITHLINRLKTDFSSNFDITLSPVAAALLAVPSGNLSGFSYATLEQSLGRKISWYNAQFYNGWGDLSTRMMYDAIVVSGWSPSKVVAGALTNPGNGTRGFVEPDRLATVLANLAERYADFGGVAGWEYFNARPEEEEPWRWAAQMNVGLGMRFVRDMAIAVLVGRSL
ncbi:MAG: hypothetical protein Q9160_001928 [Pyrenula sp. 1 TL-2023]